MEYILLNSCAPWALNMKYKNIIWDWNGTIVNDAPLFVDTMNILLKQNNLPCISLSDYKNSFCFPIEKYWEALGFRFNQKTFNTLNKRFISLYKKRMFSPLLQPNIVSVFKDLNKLKIKQFVLSASEQSLLKKSIIYYQVGGVFSGIYGVDNLNAVGKEVVGKKLLEAHSINPQETVVVGDTAYDYRVASALGCHCVLVSFGHFKYSRLLFKGCATLRSVGELRSFLFSNKKTAL